MQKDKIPQIAMVNGKCAGGGAYVAAMCDQIVMVKQNAAIFLGGPSLVKAATGEIVSEEELGGAETHTSISGVADYFANDELEGLQKIRMIIKESFQNQQTQNYHWQKFDNIEEPLFNPQEINYLLNDDLKNYQIDVRQIIARFVDGSKFLEYKKQYGPTLVTGFAQLYGQNVGIIGNNGILFSESSLKATNFIELCSQRKIPLLFLQNLPGFMVGKYYEHQGIAKHGAKLVNAIASTQVPKITLLFGGSYGAGNFGMCGRGLNPKFFYQLPNSRISVMGGQQAADVLAERKQHSLKKQNKQILSQQDIQNYKKEVIDMYEKQSQIYYSSANLWDDGVILPEQIRQQLGLSLLITLKEKIPEFNGFGTFRM
ncbi:hypothetical protein PPERSA_12427 [Pseudocohnilembus persalinus]|uniref:methylcrotonoyl-CoA carboxylase n=1 Tax=Pseudocohnilembus persalinus TaxID=266149 RepID=A0A0V0QP81_PSEPJ|nr:hypothetical protein PPERSA_12427 [Pseudocohnilembus persalinus]|eukprot:KRX03980.1 hypothetical protein PPERSA_12427 [Pseudocohnilembus persalinus]